MKKSFLVFIILLFTAHAMADDVFFPNNKIPTKPLTDVRGGPMYVVVVMPNAEFKARPSRNAQDLPNPPKFRDTLLAYEKTTDKRYYLLKTNSGDWGWMHVDDILDSSVCLRSENPKNPAFLKVLPKN
jgi:hypothetical protein